MASKIKVDEIEEQSSGSNITLKNNVVIPTGKTLTITDGIATSKITSGTFADARISQSNVTQHTVAVDLTPATLDIAMLALQSAVADNKAAFNLPNSFIDSFTDDTNIGTKTSVAVDTGAIVTNVGAGYALTDLSLTESLIHSNTTNGSIIFTQSAAAADGAFSIDGSIGEHATNGIRHSTAQKKFGSSSIYFPGGDQLAWINHPGWGCWNVGTGDFTFECWLKTDGAQGGLVGIFDHHRSSGMGTFHIDTSGYLKMMGQPGTLTSTASVVDGNWHHVAFSRTSGTGYLFKDGTQVATGSMGGSCGNSTSLKVGATDLGGYGGAGDQCFKGWMDDIRISLAGRYTSSFTPATEASTFSATGTAIQSANVVSSAKTKVGGTMIYKDNAGTATLGTDLKIYFTCNGGTNWTEAASYTAVTPVFSTGIKMLKLGETTCTEGSDVRYKAVWANQADGSKVTQLHGIGLNY
jgi:hypothetical protein